jgi:hypothetical protein
MISVCRSSTQRIFGLSPPVESTFPQMVSYPAPIFTACPAVRRSLRGRMNWAVWPAPGFEDTELGVFMGPEVSHGETKVYAGVQA